MRNIFLFIRRYSVFVAFFVLEAISLYMLFSYNRYHRTVGLGITSNITGYFNSKYNSIENFFRMGEENKRVHLMNDSLLNLVRQNFSTKDTSTLIVRDTLAIDTTGLKRIYYWRPAQVLYTTVNSDKNYLQINRGSKEGIADDMGVFSSDGGLVGKVVNTGDHYSQVMTLLNVMNKLSVKLKRSGASGILSWDGNRVNELTMNGVARTDSVKKGDTVLTGNYSLSFPPDKMVGTVEKIVKEESSNFWILKIKSTANFNTLQQVFVVENLKMQELKQLHEATVKKVEISNQKK